MKKLTTAREAVARVQSGDTLLVGGFLTTGSPETLIGALLNESGADCLTVVSNDTGTTETKMAQVMQRGRVKKVVASYIGHNPLTGQMLIENPKSVELVPQGTLAERVRAGGAGVPAFYTPVGVGTMVAEGKEAREFGGKPHILESAIHGNVAFVHATVADTHGNCFMKGTTKNFNTLMARAADFVVAEAEQIVEAGQLDPELVSVPGIFVDALVPVEG